jgi:xanthine dehydrogenase YagS FAD-binding subunit
VPRRARAAETALVDRRVDEATAAEAGRAAVQGATPLGNNAYKLPLLETLVRRAVLKAADAQ